MTAAFPTPNGDLHLGHLSGPYLRADIYTRALRMQGVEAFYLTGTDDHQSYVALKAERARESPCASADRFAGAIQETLRASCIHPDRVNRPREPAYVAWVQSFVRALHDASALVLRHAPALFCGACGEFVFEAYVSGNCPHCGAGAGGGGCEACGRPNDCADLGDPRCGRCGGAACVRPYPRLFFPLRPWEARLREYWSSVTMGPRMAALCQAVLADGLPDVPVTHRTRWGMWDPLESTCRHASLSIL